MDEKMKPKHKFNNGKGTTLCNHCNVMLTDSGFTNQVLCDKCLRKLIYEYKTYSEHGFIQEEIEDLINKFSEFNREKFDNAMIGNTCMLCDYKGEQKVVNYHCDVLTGIRCGLESRDIKLNEWD